MPLRSLPYDSPGQTYVAFEKPQGVPAVGKFSNILRFIVKEVELSTGEAEDDGVEDEYQLEELEGTEVVPSNSRSHTCLLSGVFIGSMRVLVRLSFGIDGEREVAMKLAIRSDDESVSDAIHEIVKAINEHASKQTGLTSNPLRIVLSGVAKLYGPECALVGACMRAIESRGLGMFTFSGDA
ncbi:hypothetical protein CRG98_030213 [Punica granatum]|uniref:Coatomer subunit gamma C-terminal domain-containing protein n=1 Tax=Punica granatum TaxID=22663 RepID=A0A2I0IZH1_PUNGR|nr:hypothetical protein CRG98_030213 [Punica granatum]